MTKLLPTPAGWIGQMYWGAIPGIEGPEKAKAQTALLKAFISTQHKLTQPSKNKPGYGYKYADLNDVLNAIQEATADEDIAYIQQPVADGGKAGTHNYLINSQGAIVDFGSYVLDVGGASPQKNGAALTYARRYSISCIFGIASEDDDDAQNFESKPDFLTPKELKGIKVAYGKQRKYLIDVYAMAMSGDETAKQVLKDKGLSVKAKIGVKSISAMYELSKSMMKESDKDKEIEKKSEKVAKKDPYESKKVKTSKSEDDLIKNLVDGSEPSKDSASKKNDDPFAGIGEA